MTRAASWPTDTRRGDGGAGGRYAGGAEGVVNPGVVDMLLAVVAFSVMNAIVKLGGEPFSPMELVFWRSALGAALVLPLAWRRGGLAIAHPALMVGRTVLGVSAMFTGFVALQGLTMSEASLIGKLQPVLIAVGAPLLFGEKERVDRGVWGAMALGLSGGVVILAPSVGAGSWWGLWALASAVFSAGAHLCLRPLGREEDDRAIVFWFLAGSALAGLVTAPVAEAAVRPAPLTTWPLLAGLAVSATVGQLLMTRAYQREKATVVAATAYTAPLFATGLDALIFGALPGPHVALGGAFVVAAGWMLLVGGWPTPQRLRARLSR